MVFSRQFGPVGQCYHFLGRRSDERRGLTPGLDGTAYARCMGTLRELLNVVAAPPGWSWSWGWTSPRCWSSIESESRGAVGRHALPPAAWHPSARARGAPLFKGEVST
jgi:hypothetical protein